MNKTIESVHYERGNDHAFPTEQFGVENAKKVNGFHKSFPSYSPTPLVGLKELSEHLGIKNCFVKDESFRFGLNAFKGLGGSYCIGRYIAEKLGVDIQELSYEKVKREDTKKAVGDVTFVTATDGNHGRGIAWTAAELGYKSVVFMPKGSSVERLNNIKAFGGEAYITEMNYDDTVRYATEYAEKNDGVLVQDTAWEGYEKIPGWIMEGYTTIGHEIVEQLEGEELTHIFLQAGVGAMAGAIAGYFADYYSDKKRPLITIVEPNKADCIYKTALENDGKLHAVKGDLDTIMAGLACGEPCSIGWNILDNYADSFVSVPDYIAANGMRILANPLGKDKSIVSGESGAVTLGFVAEVMKNDSLKELRERLKLNKDSKVLCISTEGDTDKEHYRKIVWDGLYSTPE
jgi:diaminopropionate ammonia-lyase